MNVIFEWDETKARMNVQKHKVGFDEARTLFNDPRLLTHRDEYHWNDKRMKKATNDTGKRPRPAEVLPEYDFRGKKGVRGRYCRAYRQGHTVRVHQDDGAVVEQHLTMEEGAVMLEPDVREYFPTSESVNQALRCLTTLIPKGQRRKVR